MTLNKNQTKLSVRIQNQYSRLHYHYYLVGDLTGVAASKWHMTPKKNQAKNTKMQPDAADASKSK